MDLHRMPSMTGLADRIFDDREPIVSPALRSNELLEQLLVQQIETNQLLLKIVEKLDGGQ